nr:cytochrome c biogenesis protein CcdA [Halomonas socia]
MDLTILSLMLLAGMLITLSPCILPVLPVMLTSGLARNRFAPLLTGAGLATGFALMGTFLHGVGHAFGLNDSVTRPFFAGILLLAGLAMSVSVFKQRAAGLFGPVAVAADNLSSRVEGRPGGSFLLGLLLGAIWSPCAGPLLGAALGLAGASGFSGLAGAGLQMAIFGIGAAIPLIVVAYAFAGSARRFLPKIAAGGQFAQQVLGISLVTVGVMILTGFDAWVLVWATENLPQTWLDLITRY